MSWGTCYSGSNNTNVSFPPMMSDGRNFSNWTPVPTRDKHIQQSNGIKSNYDYRQYLMNNGDKIIKHNQLDACNECGYCPLNPDNEFYIKGPPKMMGCNNNQVKSNSDLKNMYLSSVELNNRVFSQHITQADINKMSRQ